MSRKCPVNGCEVVTPAHKFMCRRHWLSLPKPLRDEIWRTWKLVDPKKVGGRTSDFAQRLADIAAYRAACASAEAYWNS